MKILFDFISIQGYTNGGAEHAKKVLDTLLQVHPENQYFALYDSLIPFVKDDQELYCKVIDKWVDLRSIKKIGDFIEYEHIDVFYIGIFQRYFNIDLSGIKCKVVAVIHDVSDAEFERNKIGYLYRPFVKPFLYGLYKIIKYIPWIKKNHYLDSFSPAACYEKQRNFLTNDNVEIITVSNFSANSIYYLFPFLKGKRIRVLYSPLKVTPEPITYKPVESLLQSGRKYFVLLSANRYSKNVSMVFDVFSQIQDQYPDYYLVTTGLKNKILENHIPLPFITPSELEYVFRNAVCLIYPSIIEGFGYPPIEAMKYGVPSICSNTSSIPEIVGEAGIYFSPVLRTELYTRIDSFLKKQISIDKNVLKNRYEEILKKQESDLLQLVNLICS